ncbi:MAG TPA: phosphoglucosamine mutase [Trueperaceae bacterium]|nr:phosphoglucosamine mutase [Trueperaceae bacterium]
MSERRYFGTDGVRGVAGRHPMTASFALGLGVATAELLKSGGKARPTVLIGMDTRRSGPMLALALGAGLTSRGADVTDLGVVPTPAVSYLTRALGADAGIVVSASHNPFDDNGIKVFNAAGEKLDDALEAELEDLVERVGLNGGGEPVVGAGLGRFRRLPREGGRGAADSYTAHLLANAPYLDGMKVVIDCANGAGHLLAPKVFAKIGARLEVMYADPDGENINVGCGSTSPDAVTRRVVEGGFDVGVTFDGDADRALLVDRKGRLVTGDHIMAICAVERGEREIVATHMSNLGMERYLRERGIGVRRVKVGDRYVYEELRRSGLTLGGEQSGHVLFLDKAPTGDGMLTALQLLAAVRKSGKALEEWMDEIPVYPQELVNVAVPPELKAHVSEAPEVAAAVREAEERLGEAGRVLLRPSGTEPLVRVMVEGPDHAEVRSVVDRVAEAVRRVGGAAAGAASLNA